VRPYTTLISAEELRGLLGQRGLVLVDCRFSLQDPPAGQKAHHESHLPGAVYAHLDEDLSGPVVRGKTGRHPLPELETFTRRLGAWGIEPSSQVVAYDASGGSMAGRLWWLLRWVGHQRVAVLDGGWQAWIAAGGPVESKVVPPVPRRYVPHPRPELAEDADTVRLASAGTPGQRILIDARSADRFRGENETIDPVAGHIPGAVSLPFLDNLGPSGRFKTPEELRARFGAAIGSVPLEQVVCYCGSGVTAAHNVLAIAHAGLGEARLYPGSWSEWITDPGRPIAR
jgi:thiosulfate/3-mercaptopyruvate sulfurtransferase